MKNIVFLNILNFLLINGTPIIKDSSGSDVRNGYITNPIFGLNKLFRRPKDNKLQPKYDPDGVTSKEKLETNSFTSYPDPNGSRRNFQPNYVTSYDAPEISSFIRKFQTNYSRYADFDGMERKLQPNYVTSNVDPELQLGLKNRIPQNYVASYDDPKVSATVRRLQPDYVTNIDEFGEVTSRKKFEPNYITNYEDPDGLASRNVRPICSTNYADFGDLPLERKLQPNNVSYAEPKLKFVVKKKFQARVFTGYPVDRNVTLGKFQVNNSTSYMELNGLASIRKSQPNYDASFPDSDGVSSRKKVQSNYVTNPEVSVCRKKLQPLNNTSYTEPKFTSGRKLQPKYFTSFSEFGELATRRKLQSNYVTYPKKLVSRRRFLPHNITSYANPELLLVLKKKFQPSNVTSLGDSDTLASRKKLYQNYFTRYSDVSELANTGKVLVVTPEVDIDLNGLPLINDRYLQEATPSSCVKLAGYSSSNDVDYFTGDYFTESDSEREDQEKCYPHDSNDPHDSDTNDDCKICTSNQKSSTCTTKKNMLCKTTRLYPMKCTICSTKPPPCNTTTSACPEYTPSTQVSSFCITTTEMADDDEYEDDDNCDNDDNDDDNGDNDDDEEDDEDCSVNEDKDFHGFDTVFNDFLSMFDK